MDPTRRLQIESDDFWAGERGKALAYYWTHVGRAVYPDRSQFKEES